MMWCSELNQNVEFCSGQCKICKRLVEKSMSRENKENPATPLCVNTELFCSNCYSCLVGSWNFKDDSFVVFYNYCPMCGSRVNEYNLFK